MRCVFENQPTFLQGKALCIINMSLENFFFVNKYKIKLFNYHDSLISTSFLTISLPNGVECY